MIVLRIIAGAVLCFFAMIAAIVAIILWFMEENMVTILRFLAGAVLGFVATVAAIVMLWFLVPDSLPPITDYFVYAGLLVAASYWLTRQKFFGFPAALGFVVGASAWALFEIYILTLVAVITIAGTFVASYTITYFKKPSETPA